MLPSNLLYPLKLIVTSFSEEEHDYHFRVEAPEPSCDVKSTKKSEYPKNKGNQMTPAELKTLREANGISITWLADISHVHERTVRYWESGKSLVPADVAKWILDIDAKITSHAAEKAAKIKMEEGFSRLDSVILFRYKTNEELHQFEPSLINLPATAHASILYKTRSILEKEGIKTKIVFMNTEEE